MREVRLAECACGGVVLRDETTATEDQQYGCGRKNCCNTALKCNKCGTRFHLSLDAPEFTG